MGNISSPLSVRNEKVYSSGKYSGEIKKGLRNGKGKFQWNNGDTYDGEWDKDVQNGHGMYKWSDGSFFIGDWRNGKMNGRGKLFNVRNKVLKKGYWNEGKFRKKITKKKKLSFKRKV